MSVGLHRRMSSGRHRNAPRRTARARRSILHAIVVMPLAVVLLSGVADAYWSTGAGSGGNGASTATAVNQGATPTASAVGLSVTVSWAASTLSNGAAVGGYIVKRYTSGTLIPQTILSACTGRVAGLTCVESSVPSGGWVYSVTPVLATNWRGAESLKSSTVTVDVTAPVNSISLSGVSGNVVTSGNTIYYRGAASGSFTLTNAVSDAGSGPASSATATLTGTPTGWTHIPSTVSTPAAGPYVSNPFSWTASTTTSPTEVVTGRDVANNATGTTLTFVNDSTGPTGGSVSASALVGTGFLYAISATLSLNLVKGTDPMSGVATTGAQLLRATATLTSGGTADGTCGSYGTYTLVTGGNDPASPESDLVADQACYKYQYVVADTLGNSTAYTSADIKVDLTVPTPAPSLSFGAFTNTYWSSGSIVYYRGAAASGSFTATASATDPRSGIFSYAFPVLGTNWTSTPVALGVSTYSWSAAPLAPGTKSVTATNNATGISAATSFTPTADDTAPGAGTLSYLNGTTSGTTNSVTFTTGTDGGSGLGTRLLQRASAPLTSGTCGSYTGFSTVTNGINPTSPLVDAVTGGNCYKYQYVVQDNVGNTSTTTSTNIVKITAGCATLGPQATISSTDDSYIMQASPTKTNGNDIEMFINPTKDAAMRGVVNFTLPTLGAGCTVTAATLQLKNHGGTGSLIDVYRANGPWTEATVTWNTVGTTGTAVTSTAVTGWQTWAVGAQVQAQYSGANNGFVVRSQSETGGSGAKYDTSETANAPQLIVTWG
jgi:hypothetical protein